MAQPFRCRGPAWLGNMELCYGGTSCVDNATLTLGCTPTCPGGTMGDFLFMHLPNCSMPVAVFLGLFVAHAVVQPLLAVVVAALTRAVYSRRDERFLGSCTLVLSVSTLALMLSLYVEQGMFEASVVFLVLCMMLVPFLRTLTVTAAVDSALAASASATEEAAMNIQAARASKLRLLHAVFIVAHVAPGIGMLATARDDPLRGTFNTCAISLLASDALIVTLFELRHVHDMRATMTLTGTTIQTSLAFRELKELTAGAAPALVALGLSVFGTAAFCILGSLPYMWPMIIVLFVTFDLGVVSTLVFLWRRRQDRTRTDHAAGFSLGLVSSAPGGKLEAAP